MIETGQIGPDHSLGIADITAPAEVTAAEPTMTHHTGLTADNPHTAAHWVTTLRTAVGHIHIHPIDHQNIFHTTEDHTVQDHTPTKGPKNHTFIGIGRFI